MGTKDKGVGWISVSRARVRNETVIAWIPHGRLQETIDEQSAGAFIQFIFDRFSSTGNFDDDVYIIGGFRPVWMASRFMADSFSSIFSPFRPGAGKTRR